MAFKGNFRKSMRFIPVLIRYKERKSLYRIFVELIQLLVFYRTIPYHYFSRHLYRKEITNIKDYLPDKFLYKITLELNDLEAASVLSNKLFFDIFYSQFFQNLPKVLMYNHGKFFFLGKKRHLTSSIEEFESLLFEIVHERSSQKSVFIKKTYESHGGRNTFKLTERDFPMEKAKLSDLYENVTRNAYLFQDTILQHKELFRLNPTCINTIRMDAFIDEEGNCELISAFLRMSTDAFSIVDNFSSGGCLVGVDLHTGELKEKGFTSISKSGGEILYAHPQTGVKFQGFKIPFWVEAKKLVLEVAALVPNLRLIGWDIAISEKGPVLVEGNCGYAITSSDLALGGYRANPVFKKVLKDAKYQRWIK